jgi:hypothetical protein
MPENNQEKPKIIVDDDWKAQAQAEKERLSKQVEQPAPATGAAKPGAPAGPGAQAGAQAQDEMKELPPATFTTLVNSLVAQIFYLLGGMQDPKTGRRMVDLEMAKHHIDTLAMLEEKTKGNVSTEEKQALDQALYETRMQYVQIAQRVGMK